MIGGDVVGVNLHVGEQIDDGVHLAPAVVRTVLVIQVGARLVDDHLLIQLDDAAIHLTQNSYGDQGLDGGRRVDAAMLFIIILAFRAARTRINDGIAIAHPLQPPIAHGVVDNALHDTAPRATHRHSHGGSGPRKQPHRRSP